MRRSELDSGVHYTGYRGVTGLDNDRYDQGSRDEATWREDLGLSRKKCKEGPGHYQILKTQGF